MKIQDNIDIMQALVDGKTIQAKFRTGQTWDDILNRNWSLFNFANYEYRIKPEEIPKPEPTLLERIEAAYEGKEVVLLELDEHCDDVFMLNMKYKDCHWNHITAQSMKGFEGYVYEDEVQGKAIFGLSGHPVNCDRMGGFKGHPIAVLFEK